MTDKNTQILLKSRPVGEPKESDFDIVEVDMPEPGAGEFLVRSIYMSLDPYMRGRMSEQKSYSANAGLNEVMLGGSVGQVLKSNNDKFKEGDYVVAFGGWQTHHISDGAGVMKLDPSMAPISTAIGVLGMPGLTAYVGLLDYGEPKEGETVVVAAASGAVGGVVGQIAQIKGARAIGIAGSKDKCDFVVNELGFDACLNYKDPNFAADLKAACPDGVDVYFENVGGVVFDTVLPLLNDFARIPLCGLISQYNATELPAGPNMLGNFMGNMLIKRMRLKGFIISDHPERMPDFFRDMSGWIASGKIKYREDIVEGIENAPAAFIGLLKGKNFGKLSVRLSDDETRK
jgi:NADPH-dependent curcumin reductase